MVRYSHNPRFKVIDEDEGAEDGVGLMVFGRPLFVHVIFAGPCNDGLEKMLNSSGFLKYQEGRDRECTTPKSSYNVPVRLHVSLNRFSHEFTSCQFKSEIKTQP